ncbi:hypothetical protein JZU46_06745, partial [bacterium]|nr:hypothetical protein [bacterium]
MSETCIFNTYIDSANVVDVAKVDEDDGYNLQAVDSVFVRSTIFIQNQPLANGSAQNFNDVETNGSMNDAVSKSKTALT